MERMRKPIIIRCIKVLIVMLAIHPDSSYAQYNANWEKEATFKSNPDTKWFKDAKFGLFIHWGLYSKLAGDWRGKRYYGSGEWIMNRAKIPVSEYANPDLGMGSGRAKNGLINKIC